MGTTQKNIIRNKQYGNMKNVKNNKFPQKQKEKFWKNKQEKPVEKQKEEKPAENAEA